MKEQNQFLVLIVDDDKETREVLEMALSPDYRILHAADGEEAVGLARANRPDIVILDMNMPRKDGLWACEQLRSNDGTRHIPILVLSSRRELEQKLEAYSVGADDYLEKPFTMSELKAKVAAKTRRLEERLPKEIAKGNLVLFLERMEAMVEGRRCPLSVLETRLLAYFLMNPDEVHPRRQILTSVWKDVNVSDRTVDAHIVGLRRKIAGFDHEIVTVYGAGYSLKPKEEKSQSSRSSN
ncbi:MAG: response regulator transcription factor [Bdellovibrionaceae bacterium]|nr:response regulator transcription factor [Pseudobdellovibrionaceae bacterium]MBX3035030.1 response regulator transcription factor [Pseudobdellovibrionaceae bacterium]